MRRIAALTTAILAAAIVPALADEACPKRGGTLTYSYASEPVALSTLRTTSIPVSILSGKIYESLVTSTGPEMTPVPQLATSWTLSDDQKTYTFKLRQGVKWQDGQNFTSADVKYSIEKAIRPYHSRGEIFFNVVDSIDTPDDFTVVFHLKRPESFFLQAFVSGSAPIMPKHILEKIDTNSRQAVTDSILTTKPVGTGPFQLKEWVKGDHVTLERNPNYWQAGLPCLDNVVMRIIPDDVARSIALENGELDLLPMNSLPNSDLARLQKKPEFEVSDKGTEGLGGTVWLDLNVRSTPLSDMKVRQALSLSLDRQAIINVIWFGRGVASRGPLVATNPFFDKSLPPLPYDLKKANALLDDAGYKRGANGTRFEIKQLVLPSGEEYVRLGEYVRQQFKKIGVDVHTQSLDMGGWLKAVFTDWDYGMTSTSTDNRNDPTIGTERLFTTPFIHKGATFTNSSGYSNPKMDALFAAGAAESDPAKRHAIFDQMQVLMQQDMPVLFLLDTPRVSIWNKRVHGVLTNGLSYYAGWEKVWKN
jgi:peptide/nickel transport system substrate-binding protein